MCPALTKQTNAKPNTVEALWADTLVSRQLYLQLPWQTPVWTLIQTLYLHIPISSRGHFWGVRQFGFLCCFYAPISGHPKGTILLADIHRYLWIASVHFFAVRLFSIQFFCHDRHCIRQTFNKHSFHTVFFALILFNASGTSCRKWPPIPYTASGRLRESFPLAASSSCGHFFGFPRVSAYRSFDCTEKTNLK